MPTAIRATYADIRTVRTRKVFQIVFEGPLEEMGAAMELFGPPMPDAEVWAGIARLVPAKPQQQIAADNEHAAEHSPRPLSQISAYLCTLQPFRMFLAERQKRRVEGADQAATELRAICKVTSRKEFDTDMPAAARFRGIRAEYNNWMQS